jgi:hypothetical protein
MRKKSFLYLIVIAVMCLFLPGNGFSEEGYPFLPSEYPAWWEVIFGQAQTTGIYPLNPGTSILTKGTVFDVGGPALPCDIIWNRDVPVTLRDGTIIYTDIFRPASSPTDLPAIIAWSPYGKSVPTAPSATVPANWFSGLAKGEGPDAAFWCCNGYAVLNPDARGAYNSGGNIHYWGLVDAGDGHDVVEWVARQHWSNGKVAFAGNSWLAIVQWYIAATQPPHLTAIAPWNGLSDEYRNDVLQGGIPDIFFNELVTGGLKGYNLVEEPWAMAEKYPHMNPYWEDKAAKLENITVPAYVVADGATTLHRFGALEGFRRISSQEKWLRINDTDEWHDQYTPANEQDLLRFFDHYLKGINNGWERTPKVRVSVLDPGGVDQVNVPFTSWPLVQTEYRKFYLDAATDTLSPNPVTKESSISYDANSGQATFTMGFDEDTYVIGYLKLRLWVEADGANDMDLFVLVEKLDAQGNILIPAPDFAPYYLPVPPPGAPGRLRVSLRNLDPVRSTYFMPVQSFLQNDYLSPGQIVPVDIAIYPEGVLWHAGQQLRLIVAGHIIDAVPPVPTINAGYHIIRTGLKYDSYLQLPIIPPK